MFGIILHKHKYPTRTWFQQTPLCLNIFVAIITSPTLKSSYKISQQLNITRIQKKWSRHWNEIIRRASSRRISISYASSSFNWLHLQNSYLYPLCRGFFQHSVVLPFITLIPIVLDSTASDLTLLPLLSYL